MAQCLAGDWHRLTAEEKAAWARPPEPRTAAATAGGPLVLAQGGDDGLGDFV